jgi:hypothetical protein
MIQLQVTGPQIGTQSILPGSRPFERNFDRHPKVVMRSVSDRQTRMRPISGRLGDGIPGIASKRDTKRITVSTLSQPV